MTKAQVHEKILRAINEQTAKATTSKRAARDTLIKEGIYTADGRLREEYGGGKEHAAA